ncbi:MAG TPA: hypothetical protein VE219_07045 [Candidatus Sulfotelmatobacter sp.]|nr:hypothetical protein [Candidatus Sulfotelmatobacter sp.]
MLLIVALIIALLAIGGGIAIHPLLFLFLLLALVVFAGERRRAWW